MDVLRIPVLQDNYLWLIDTGDAVGAVDPALAEPVLEALGGRKLDWILNTHHHWDHTGANLELKETTGCRIVGPAMDERIPGRDVGVADGDTFTLGSQVAEVLFVPGHTRGHIAYHFAATGHLFCGDTLFIGGCGRLFEGTGQEMWASLEKIRALPGDTQVCCAHEYTASNLRFALSVEPDNATLVAWADEVGRLRDAGQPTVPGLLSREWETNPFLRCHLPSVQAAVGMTGSPAGDVLAEVRRRKDSF
ncbi:MAG: hydroxyacylglutathione hydrolase [Proteobacteria bacterium]|nr:hydroxyacylglutathione hydrolase [Pseudomonadota bacterium]MCP4918603.1 hydroxyacylglutathione hydrolase [Pseudomonadota bacterium]